MNPTARPTAFAAAAAFLLLSASGTHPATIRVPADQPTITAGLAAAVAGDEVVVACGDYSEQHLVVPSGVTLRSATGGFNCVHLTSALHNYHLVRIDTASNVLVQGFSLRSRGARSIVILNSSGVRIENCEFRGSDTRFGGILDIEDSQVTATGCHFENNYLRPLGGSSQVRADGNVSLVDCSFAYTSAIIGYPNAAVAFSGNGPHQVRDTVFDDIWGTCISVTGCEVTVEATRFWKGSHAPYAVAPIVGVASGGILTFRNCVAESTGWGDDPWSPPDGVNECFGVSGGGTLRFESCTVTGAESYFGVVWNENARVEVARSIFVGSRAQSVFRSLGGSLAMTCVNVYASSGAVFGGSTPPDTQGVFSADPLFCDPVHGDYRLAADSPCLPGATPCGDLVGALAVGCGAVAVEATSWGKIKNLYR